MTRTSCFVVFLWAIVVDLTKGDPYLALGSLVTHENQAVNSHRSHPVLNIVAS